MEAIKPQHHTSRSLRSWRHPFFCRVHPMLSLALCCQSCDADDGYAETGPKNPKSRGRPKKPLRNQGGLFIASTTTPVVPAAQLSPATAAAAAAAAAAATAAAAASAADAEAAAASATTTASATATATTTVPLRTEQATTPPINRGLSRSAATAGLLHRFAIFQGQEALHVMGTEFTQTFRPAKLLKKENIYWGNHYHRLVEDGSAQVRGMTPEKAEALTDLMQLVTTNAQDALWRIPMVKAKYESMWNVDMKKQNQPVVTEASQLKLTRLFITRAKENGFMECHDDAGSVVSSVTVLDNEFTGECVAVRR